MRPYAAKRQRDLRVSDMDATSVRDVSSSQVVLIKVKSNRFPFWMKNFSLFQRGDLPEHENDFNLEIF